MRAGRPNLNRESNLMKPHSRTLCTLIILVLLISLLHAAPTYAQQRRTRPRRVSTPHSQQSSPEQTAPPADIMTDARSRETAALKALSPSQKATIGEAIWMLDNALRAWTMMFDKGRFLNDLEVAMPSIRAAAQVLPQQGSLRLNIASGSTAMLDALTAYEYALNGRNVNEMMAIITRYNLRTTDAKAITAALTKAARSFIDQAQDTAREAGIPLAARSASEQSAVAPSMPACMLTIEQAPSVRGFRLGMSVDEVRGRFRSLKVQPPATVNYNSDYGYLEASIHVADILTIYPQYKEDFKGIQSVTMRFLDGRMTYLAVMYDDSTQWNDVDALLPSLTASLGLPAPEAWQVEKIKLRNREEQGLGKQLDCRGFKVVVWALSRVQVFFHDTTAPDILSRRMREKAEQQRREFKP
jgi:hypothetical protein